MLTLIAWGMKKGQKLIWLKRICNTMAEKIFGQCITGEEQRLGSR
jgi:hypothetical protein